MVMKVVVVFRVIKENATTVGLKAREVRGP